MAMNFDELQAEYEKTKAIIANHEARLVRMESLFCTVCSGINLFKRVLVMVCDFCAAVDEAGSLPVPVEEPDPEPTPEPEAPSSPWPTTPDPEPEPAQDINNPPSVAFVGVRELAYMGGRWYWLSRSNNQYTLYYLYKKSDGSWAYNLNSGQLVTSDAIEKIVANPWQPIPGGG